MLPALRRLVPARGVVHGGVDGPLDFTVNALGTSLIVLVAALHLWFLVLEMFLWTHPIGPFGALTASKRILYVQAVPALVALVVVLLEY